MKPLITILAFSLILPLFSIAQSNYRPGYVINLKGDTLKGFIDYQEWNSNPQSIDFKIDIKLEASQTFMPEDVTFFNVDDIETYQSYFGKISLDRIDAAHVNYGKDTSSKVTPSFLKILEVGNKVTVLSYTDALRAHFYIQEKSAKVPTELIYNLYIVEDPNTGNDKTINNDLFKRQLYALAQKYNMLTDKMQSDIQDADYKKYDILQIVSKINNMTAPSGIAKRIYKHAADFFVTAGANIVSNSPKPGSPFSTDGGGSYTSTKPLISFGVDFFVNPNTRQTFFRVEFGLAESSYNDSYIAKVSPFFPTKASFDELATSITPQVGYNVYNGENFKFYLAAGLAFTLYSHSNIFYGTRDSPFSQASYFYDFSSYDNPLILKAGAQFSKQIGVYVSYLSRVFTTNSGYFGLRKTAEQIALKYTFK